MGSELEEGDVGESETVMTKEEKNVTGDEEGDQVIQSGSADPLISLPNWETPCSSFFQQKGAIDFKSYLRLKKEEKDAVLQFSAATKIQAIWRGFLTRSNLRILHGSAAKIQKRLEKRHLKLQNEAATKIQAAWKGYNSRKSKLNFKEYKKIQEKNAALERSIDQINDLEAALVNESSSGRRSSNDLKSERGNSSLSIALSTTTTDTSSVRSSGSLKSTAGGGESVESLIRDGFQDLANNMTANRVAELRTYAHTSTKCKEVVEPKKSSKTQDRIRVDSVSDLFPEFPDNIDGIVRPDAEKVESLKEAIRLLHQRMKAKESENMEKMHHLLRTTVLPGVYSDIYTNELTEIEKELKGIKFWTSPPDPRKKGDFKKTFVSTKDDLQGQRKSSSKKKPSGFAERKSEDEEEAEYIHHPSSPMTSEKEPKFPLTSDEEGEANEMIRQ